MAVVVKVRIVTRRIPDFPVLGRDAAVNLIGRDVFQKSIASRLKKGLAPQGGGPQKSPQRHNPKSRSAKVLMNRWAGVRDEDGSRLSLGFLDSIKEAEKRRRALRAGKEYKPPKPKANRKRQGGFQWATKVTKAQARRWLADPAGLGPARAFITPGAMRSDYARNGTVEMVITETTPKAVSRSKSGAGTATAKLVAIRRYMQARGYSIIGTDKRMVERATETYTRLIRNRWGDAKGAVKPTVVGR